MGYIYFQLCYPNSQWKAWDIPCPILDKTEWFYLLYSFYWASISNDTCKSGDFNSLGTISLISDFDTLGASTDLVATGTVLATLCYSVYATFGAAS